MVSMLRLLQTLTKSGPSRFSLKNADLDHQMHLGATIRVSTGAAPTREEVEVALFSQDVQVARAAIFLEMLAVAAFSNVAGRLVTSRPKDVGKFRPSEITESGT